MNRTSRLSRQTSIQRPQNLQTNFVLQPVITCYHNPTIRKICQTKALTLCYGTVPNRDAKQINCVRKTYISIHLISLHHTCIYHYSLSSIIAFHNRPQTHTSYTNSLSLLLKPKHNAKHKSEQALNVFSTRTTIKKWKKGYQCTCNVTAFATHPGTIKIQVITAPKLYILDHSATPTPCIFHFSPQHHHVPPSHTTKSEWQR